MDRLGFQTHASASVEAGETKLLLRQGAIQVKIEVNFVMRDTVNQVRMAPLTQSARDTLQADLEIPVVSLEDVYDGNLVAAIDRQHPRDLFDSCNSSRTRESRRHPPRFCRLSRQP